MQFEFEQKTIAPFRDHTTEKLEMMRDDLSEQLAAYRLWLEKREYTHPHYGVAGWSPINAAVRARMLYRIARELGRRDIITEAGAKLTRLHYQSQLAQSVAA